MNTEANQRARLGISGTGFISKGLAHAIARDPRFTIGAVLTRRDPREVEHPCTECLTRNLEQLLDRSDLVVECSGDVLQATEVIASALERGLPVVTMNSEFHVTVGSALAGQGWLSEGEGDQPGCLAAFDRRIRGMGFEPVLHGNIKGFLNHDPTPGDMRYWGEKQGISLPQVTAFTDGTKIQIEQALVANGLRGDILQPGLAGPETDDLESAGFELARRAEQTGKLPASDYVLKSGGPAGVFIVARHSVEQQPYLDYLKLGPGPWYCLVRPFHLCHLEMLQTLEEALKGAPVLLNNGTHPKVGVRALAKRDLPAGHLVDRALGGFDFRGEAVPFDWHAEQVPIGLLQNARLAESVAAGEPLRWEQVELPDSRALNLFRSIAPGGSG